MTDTVNRAREFLEGQVAIVEYDNAQRTISGILRQLGEAMALLAELTDEVDRLQAKVAAFADIEEAHNASYRMLRDQSGMTELVAEVERLRARLDAVLAIHSDRNGDCAECEMTTGQGVTWPCWTYNAAIGVES